MLTAHCHVLKLSSSGLLIYGIFSPFLGWGGEERKGETETEIETERQWLGKRWKQFFTSVVLQPLEGLYLKAMGSHKNVISINVFTKYKAYLYQTPGISEG